MDIKVWTENGRVPVTIMHVEISAGRLDPFPVCEQRWLAGTSSYLQ
jgi:hypothetical protein